MVRLDEVRLGDSRFEGEIKRRHVSHDTRPPPRGVQAPEGAAPRRKTKDEYENTMYYRILCSVKL